MGAYALDILPLIKFLLQFINLNEMNAKEAVFADDFPVAGRLNCIKDYWDELAIGPKYGYFQKPAKPYLIVNEKKLLEAQNLFANSPRWIYWGYKYCDEYVKDLVKDWNN